MRSSAVTAGSDALAAQYNNLRNDAQGGSRLFAHEQATPDFTVKIEDGIVYVGSTQVVYAGGNSPAMTAPSANPRIDLITINSSGTIVVTNGAEAASPSAPTYPVDEIPICEIHHRVGSTKILDADDSSNSYIRRDVRPFLDGGLVKTSGAQTVAGVKTFSSIPVLPASDPTTDNQAARKVYVDTTAARKVASTAGEAINAATTPQVVYLNSSNKVQKLQADDVLGTIDLYLGIVGDSQNVALDAAVNVYLPGATVSGYTGLTAGAPYYLSDTPGAIATTPGTNHVLIGFAISTTQLLMIARHPNDEVRTARAQIANNTDVATSTGGGTNTDTVVTHGLGKKPKLIIISGTVHADSNPATGDADGTFVLAVDGSGNLAWGMLLTWKRGITTGSNFGANELSLASLGNTTPTFAADGATANETIAISLLSIGATTFTFRINGILSGADPGASTVQNTYWTAIA